MAQRTAIPEHACPCTHREAFAAWLPLGGVPLSYAIAIGYVLVDTADKGVKAFQMAQQELGGNAALHPEVDTPKCATPPSVVSMPQNLFACNACLELCVQYAINGAAQVLLRRGCRA